jgi:NAD(P)-dependent dehydrogenase (short-subunit alcohol dehydrogenase family)
MTASPNSARPLNGRSVLIFGGTSGIGLSTARQAQAAGARVIVVGFDAVGAERVAQENGFAGWRSADVTKPETIAQALGGIDHVDHLVLLAGTFVAGKVAEAEVDYLRRAFDERLWAAVHTLRGLGERLAADGSVTFISGVLGDRPNAMGTAVLAAASTAMESFARGLALEQAPRRFNTVSPGTTDTPLLARTLGPARDAYIDSLKSKLPLRRLATPEEVGAAVVFLMSNGYMNGETIHVDGGSRLV